MPFEKGLESKRVLSTFPAIDTVVDGLQLSYGLERIAQVMDRGTIVVQGAKDELSEEQIKEYLTF